MSEEYKRTVKKAEAIQVRQIFKAIRDGANVPKDILIDLGTSGRRLPPDIREYIALRIKGRIKPRGRPVAHLSRIRVGNSTVLMQPSEGVKAIVEAFQREQLLNEYDELRKELWRLRGADRSAFDREWKRFKRTDHPTPARLAYAILAERHNSTYDSIHNTISHPIEKKRTKSRD